MNQPVQMQILRVRRLLDDIAHISPQAHDQTADCRLTHFDVRPHYLPSPQQIREECRRIRADWTEEVRQHRAQLVTANTDDHLQPAAATNVADHQRQPQAACA